MDHALSEPKYTDLLYNFLGFGFDKQAHMKIWVLKSFNLSTHSSHGTNVYLRISFPKHCMGVFRIDFR